MAFEDLGPNQRAWYEALKSGRFKQGIDRLQTCEDPGGDRFCCLGVACRSVPSSVPVFFKTNTFGAHVLNGVDLSLQPEVVKALGLYSKSGIVNQSDPRRVLQLQQKIFDCCEQLQHSFELSGTNLPEFLSTVDTGLVGLNDDYRLTFDQIADIICEFPDLYFIASV